MIALLAACLAQPSVAQSIRPGGAQPAVSLPAKIGNPSRRTTPEPAVLLRNVTILRGKTSVEVHIEATAPVKPAVMMLSRPERIVVDLAGVGCGGGHRLLVNAGGIESVRVGLFREDPPVTRVVVDLTHRHEYRLLPAGSTVILAIDLGASLSDTLPPSTPKVTRATSPPSQPVPDKVPTTANGGAASAPTPVSNTAESPASAVVKAPAGETKLQPQPPQPPQPVLPAIQPAEPAVSATLPQVMPPVQTGQSEPSSPGGEEETTRHQAAKAGKPGVVRSLTVLREKDGIVLRIEASQPVRASTSRLSNPERIILDLADMRLPHPRHMAVNSADVQDVNAALFLVNPLVTRVVIDLARPHAYHVQASGNSLTLTIETEEVKAAGTQPAH